MFTIDTSKSDVKCFRATARYGEAKAAIEIPRDMINQMQGALRNFLRTVYGDAPYFEQAEQRDRRALYEAELERVVAQSAEHLGMSASDFAAYMVGALSGDRNSARELELRANAREGGAVALSYGLDAFMRALGIVR